MIILYMPTVVLDVPYIALSYITNTPHYNESYPAPESLSMHGYLDSDSIVQSVGSIHIVEDPT